jgi:hypothetical protein
VEWIMRLAAIFSLDVAAYAVKDTRGQTLYF